MRVVLVLAAGCIYMPHSYSHLSTPFPGKRVELSCLDLAVGITEDDRAPRAIEYSFGNRCFHSVVVDLASVRAFGRYPDGHTVELAAYDPKHEIVPLPIDGLWKGDERIEYAAADSAVPAAICVDVGKIDRSGPASEHWVCVGMWELP